jgi:hypothetical protein
MDFIKLIGILLLVTSFPEIYSSAKCNSFPKIFGTSSGYPTLLYQIDAFNDYLALAGSSRDSINLIGISNDWWAPYIAVSSI